MPADQWFRPPRHVLVLFLAVTLLPAVGLVWLGWRLVEQDRALERQRVQERLENAGDRMAAALERRLAEIESQLPAAAVAEGDDALVVVFSPRGVESRRGAPLVYHPFLALRRPVPAKVFEAGEELEFRRQDYAGAAAAFRELARSGDLQVRAEALVRLARNLRKSNQRKEALAVYQDLERLGSVPVGGEPAELVARAARCTVLEELKQFPELHRTAARLHADLQQGRWQLDRASYLFHAQEAQRRSGSQAATDGGLALAAAVEALWEQWQESRRAGENWKGWRSIPAPGASVLAVWRGTPEKLAALVAGPRYLEARWQDLWRDPAVAVTLTDAGGHRVLGQPAVPGQRQVVRHAGETQLPWSLGLAGRGGNDSFRARRPLMLAGLALIALLVTGGSYFIARGIARELAVARLQSDFVSAVSHEFRTPLTSMSHLTELLEGGAVTAEERRRQYYGLLARETRRLRHLVESLLSFGRMEAGALEYRFQPLDPGELAREVAAEFQAEAGSGDHRIEVSVGDALPPVRADREALARALWNLLDNAVKYSPGSPSVRLEVAGEAERVAVRVRDEGLGIPADERKEIFRKFVRGAAARAANVKGTGIGLALVEHIVKAHGGEMRVESEPGKGSTFTILLPGAKGKS